MKVRKHWFVLVSKLIVPVIFLFVPLLLLFALRSVEGYMSADTLEAIARTFSGPLIVFFALLWSFCMWIWAFIIWTDYYLDIWVVTNKRVFDIEQKGFFQREISILRMDRVQDITTNVRGIIPTFFNFGEIHVQTAGSDKEFVMRGAPAPSSLKQVISSLQDQRQNQGDYSGEDGL